MEYKRRTAVHLVKRFAHAREEHNREFQSFTLVNTHDTHRVCALPVNIHLAEIDFILLKLLDITDKVEQSTVTRRLKFHRLFHQHLQICPPLYAARHRDNPCQEIPFTAILRSPICGCTDAELAAVRCVDKDVKIYEACGKYASEAARYNG